MEVKSTKPQSMLLQPESGDDKRGRPLIPAVWHSLKGQLELALIAGTERRRAWSVQPAYLARDDVLRKVVEFQAHFDLGHRARPSIRNRAVDVGDFLLQHIGGAAQRKVAELDLRRIGLFRCPHR